MLNAQMACQINGYSHTYRHIEDMEKLPDQIHEANGGRNDNTPVGYFIGRALTANVLDVFHDAQVGPESINSFEENIEINA